MEKRSGVLGLCILVLLSFGTFAEPWLATRFAQNCSACHAPGRVNVPPKQRRCTLSCQGCHTNPNGGGLRNFYGKWTEQRWLNSAYFKDYKLNKPRPMPTSDQSYADDRIKNLSKDAEQLHKVATLGYKLHETAAYTNEKDYDRRSTHEKFVEPIPDMALARIPENDPYRQRRENYFNAGIDSRFFYMDEKKVVNGVETKVNNAFPMATDLGVSVEPLQNFTVVLESRFLNPPSNPAWDRAFESESRVRSAYVMIDNLAYNSYLMYGLYRPMFGNYNPDHTSLFNVISGLNQRAVFKTASFGTAPNVPFLNVHWIDAMNNALEAQDKGYALNLGARFVTLGAYGMLSLWNTKAQVASQVTNRRMTDVTFGFTAKRWTAVVDFARIQKEQINVTNDAGNVLTVENRLRIWRENYLKLNYENANTARDLTVGSTTAYSAGLNFFYFSSVEFELMYRDLKETIAGAPTTEKAYWSQLHFFF